MYNFINVKTIHEYLGEDNQDLIIEMVGLILQINLTELEELPQFYKQNDLETIKKRCHKAKPSLSYIGASSTLELIEQIELNLTDSRAINDRLQENIREIREELKHFIQSFEN